MNRSVSSRPSAGKVPPSLQQQLASGKRAKAARQAQQAQGKRKAADSASLVPDAAPVGANVAGASHVSASRLLALLTQPAAVPAAVPTRPPVSSSSVQSTAAIRPQVVESVASSPLHASYSAAPLAAASSISDNRRRQMGSSVFNNDAPSPLLTTQHTATSSYQHSLSPTTHQPSPHIHHPLTITTQTLTPLTTTTAVTSPTGRQSWGGGGRSLEAGDGARDAERQKKAEMRANLDAQMREKEENKRREKLQSGRVQEHWLDGPVTSQAAHVQPPSTASHPSTGFSQTASHLPPALPPYAAATASTAQPYSVEPSTARTLSASHPHSTQPSAPSSSVHLSSIRSHNQSSSVFATAGNDTTEQRKAQVRQEVQAALRQQMEEKKQREEEKKRREQEEEKRWEEKLERERREMANKHVSGGGVVEEERKEAVVTARGGAGASAVAIVQEEKQQLSIREDRREKAEKKQAGSSSDEEDDDKRRRRRKSDDKKASRERGRRSTRRHSDSDDSASSYSDDSGRHHRRHKSSRQRSRSRRRERRKRYSSPSSEDEEERMDDECIYVTDSAYTHRLRYEQEQKEMESAMSSATTSRRSSTTVKTNKPNSASSNRSTSSLSTRSATQPKPPFGVRSLQSRAQPKPPASRVRASPPPLPSGDTRAGKQALSAARLAVGRTSSGGDKFVAQKWKEKQSTTQQTPPERSQQLRKVEGGREGRREAEGKGMAVVAAAHSVVVDEVVAGVQELSFADRLDSTSEWLLPHSLGLPSFRA